MPLYFAYGSNMDASAMARRCPRSKALGPARLLRHRLAVMREGWLTIARDPRSAVHGVLWELALADVPALDRYEGLAAVSTSSSSSRSSPSAGRGRRSSISAPTPGREPCVKIISPTSSPPRARGRCRRRRPRRSSGLRQSAGRRGAVRRSVSAAELFRTPVCEGRSTCCSLRPLSARSPSRRPGSARHSGRPGPGACRTDSRWRSTRARPATDCRARSRRGRF